MAEGIPQPQENTPQQQEGFARFFRHPSSSSRENTTSYNRFFRHPFGGRTPEQEQAFAQYLQQTAATEIPKEKSKWLGQASFGVGLAVGRLLGLEFKLLKYLGDAIFNNTTTKKLLLAGTPFDFDEYFKRHEELSNRGKTKR